MNMSNNAPTTKQTNAKPSRPRLGNVVSWRAEPVIPAEVPEMRPTGTELTTEGR
jgi:hypothetical protein